MANFIFKANPPNIKTKKKAFWCSFFIDPSFLLRLAFSNKKSIRWEENKIKNNFLILIKLL